MVVTPITAMMRLCGYRETDITTPRNEPMNLLRATYIDCPAEDLRLRSIRMKARLRQQLTPRPV